MCATFGMHWFDTKEYIISKVCKYCKNKIEIKEDITPRSIDKNVMLVLPNFNSFFQKFYKEGNLNELPETLYIKIYYDKETPSMFLTNNQYGSELSDVVECNMKSSSIVKIMNSISTF